MNLCPLQPAVTAPSQAAVPGQVGYLLLDPIAIAVGCFPFLTGQPLPRLPVVGLVIADVYPSSRSVFHTLRL